MRTKNKKKKKTKNGENRRKKENFEACFLIGHGVEV